jgi:hypothetical protein
LLCFVDLEFLCPVILIKKRTPLVLFFMVLIVIASALSDARRNINTAAMAAAAIPWTATTTGVVDVSSHALPRNLCHCELNYLAARPLALVNFQLFLIKRLSSASTALSICFLSSAGEADKSISSALWKLPGGEASSSTVYSK